MSISCKEHLIVTVLACLLWATTIYAADPPKYAPDVPAKITTPDTVETRIGTLHFKDGAPDPATVQMAY